MVVEAFCNSFLDLPMRKYIMTLHHFLVFKWHLLLHKKYKLFKILDVNLILKRSYSRL